MAKHHNCVGLQSTPLAETYPLQLQQSSAKVLQAPRPAGCLETSGWLVLVQHARHAARSEHRRCLATSFWIDWLDWNWRLKRAPHTKLMSTKLHGENLHPPVADDHTFKNNLPKANIKLSEQKSREESFQTLPAPAPAGWSWLLLVLPSSWLAFKRSAAFSSPWHAKRVDFLLASCYRSLRWALWLLQQKES